MVEVLHFGYKLEIYMFLLLCGCITRPILVSYFYTAPNICTYLHVFAQFCTAMFEQYWG